MAERIIQTETLEGIANSIRSKTGKSEAIPVPNIASEIESISTGITPSGIKNITENGTYDVTNYASAKVDVEVGITPSGTKSITSNGTYDVTNYASANVSVAGVSLGDVELVNSSVSVVSSMPSYLNYRLTDGTNVSDVKCTLSGLNTDDIVPEVIKEGTNILGVIGTYTGGSDIALKDQWAFVDFYTPATSDYEFTGCMFSADYNYDEIYNGFDITAHNACSDTMLDLPSGWKQTTTLGFSRLWVPKGKYITVWTKSTTLSVYNGTRYDEDSFTYTRLHNGSTYYGFPVMPSNTMFMNLDNETTILAFDLPEEEE